MNLFRRCLIVALAASLWGCATSPYSTETKAKSDALLAQQVQAAKAQIAQDPSPRLLLAGFAMDDRSEAFRHDVLLAEVVAHQIDPQAVVFKLVNPVPGQEADLPYATKENTEAVLKTLGELARPQDKVMLLMSTHGNVGLLAVHAGRAPIGAVRTADLQRWLEPLRGQPTFLVISSCYSGSFIEPLRQVSRMILTASAKDRASFGCQPNSNNTFFVKELLRQPTLLTQSVRQLMTHASAGVATLETKMGLSPPSSPSFFFGAAAQDWSNQPIGAWLKTTSDSSHAATTH